jgi:GNAT superfamily N-acetyltransferase
MVGCEVRLAVEADLLGIERLHHPGLALTDDALTARQRATWAEMLATTNLSVYVATDADEAVVGTASLLVMPNLGYDCRPTAFIEAVVVAEAFRRKGVGTSIIARLVADARAGSCRKVQLVSHKRHRDDGASQFYEAVGFVAEADGFRLYVSTD